MSQPERVESIEQRKALLRLARETAEVQLDRRTPSSVVVPAIQGCYGGLFVTFWARNRLRGCVGSFVSTNDLPATLQNVTRSSLVDSRFATNPITADELPELTIEISILTSPQPTDDPRSLEPGKHGILIRQGVKSGCFLPKVAAERGWSAEEFLSKCCTMKVGLSADGWRHPDTEVLLFTADVITEPMNG